jgi:hypothetical protein
MRNLVRDVANFRPYCLTDDNPSMNTDGIFAYRGIMVKQISDGLL